MHPLHKCWQYDYTEALYRLKWALHSKLSIGKLHLEELLLWVDFQTAVHHHVQGSLTPVVGLQHV